MIHQETTRVIINGITKYLKPEELDYVKRFYGYWEEIYIFNSPGFYKISEIAEFIGVKTNTVYQKNRRDPVDFPLEELNGEKGVFIDTLFNYWLK